VNIMKRLVPLLQFTAKLSMMKTIQTSQDHWRCFMELEEYRLLCEYAEEMYGEDEIWVLHVIRILALSVRVGTINRITPEKFREGERGIMLLRVWEKNSRGNTDQRRPRDIWVPRPLYTEIEKYIEDNNISPDSSLFLESESTFRRRFDALTEKLAEETGDDDWLKVTPHDLRRYYAVHFMFRLNLDPALVRQMGGWLSEESMLEYLILPDDVLVDELEDRGVLGTNAPAHHNGASDVESLMESFHSLLYRIEPEARAKAVHCVEESLNQFEGINADVSINIDELKDIDDPSEPSQRRIRMYSGIPAMQIAEMMRTKAHSGEVEAGIEQAQNKIQAFREHPEYIDPDATAGRIKLSMGLLAVLGFSILFTVMTNTPVMHTTALSALSVSLAALRINLDLREIEVTPV
jgi:hypothetical protein